MSEKDQITQLFERHMGGTLTAEERQQWSAILADPANAEMVQEAIKLLLEQQQLDSATDTTGWDKRITDILEMDKNLPAPVRKMSMTRIWWAAASVVIITLGATLLKVYNGDKKPEVIVSNKL